MKNDEIKKGETLTIDKDIISGHGTLIFRAGQKVLIERVISRKEFWGSMSGTFYPEEIIGVNLHGIGGDWPLSMFIETKSELT